MATDGTKSNPKGMTNERIFETFQTLRKEQLHVGNKIAQLESDLHEHKIVIEALKEVDGDRKCFNMVGDVLCERTVKEVLPVIMSNQEQITKCVKVLTGILNKKSQELAEFKEKYDLKMQGQDEPSLHGEDEEKKPHTGNVLVVNPM